MNTVKKAVIALICAGAIFCFKIAYDRNTAFDECLKEVSSKCSSLIQYATMLEKENARLNRVCKARQN